MNILFQRNGELKRQEMRIQERVKQETLYLRKAAKSAFEALSYKMEIDFKIPHDSTVSYKLNHQAREDTSPLVARGHMILDENPNKSERILSDFSLRNWNFGIYQGGYSQSGENWRTGEYNWMLEGNHSNNFEEFEKRLKEEYELNVRHPIDYIIIEGNEPVSCQPLYIQIGKIPNPEKPFFRRTIDTGKYAIKPLINPLSQFEKYNIVEKVRVSE